MNIETFELQANPKNNGTKGIIKGIKKLQFESADYPQIDIENLHLTDNREVVTLTLKMRMDIKKDELYSLLKAVKDEGEFWAEESMPLKFTIECDPEKADPFYWQKPKYAHTRLKCDKCHTISDPWGLSGLFGPKETDECKCGGRLDKIIIEKDYPDERA